MYKTNLPGRIRQERTRTSSVRPSLSSPSRALKRAAMLFVTFTCGIRATPKKSIWASINHWRSFERRLNRSLVEACSNWTSAQVTPTSQVISTHYIQQLLIEIRLRPGGITGCKASAGIGTRYFFRLVRQHLLSSALCLNHYMPQRDADLSVTRLAFVSTGSAPSLYPDLRDWERESGAARRNQLPFL